MSQKLLRIGIGTFITIMMNKRHIQINDKDKQLLQYGLLTLQTTTTGPLQEAFCPVYFTYIHSYMDLPEKKTVIYLSIHDKFYQIRMYISVLHDSLFLFGFGKLHSLTHNVESSNDDSNSIKRATQTGHFRPSQWRYRNKVR